MYRRIKNTICTLIFIIIFPILFILGLLFSFINFIGSDTYDEFKSKTTYLLVIPKFIIDNFKTGFNVEW